MIKRVSMLLTALVVLVAVFCLGYYFVEPLQGIVSTKDTYEKKSENTKQNQTSDFSEIRLQRTTDFLGLPAIVVYYQYQNGSSESMVPTEAFDREFQFIEVMQGKEVVLGSTTVPDTAIGFTLDNLSVNGYFKVIPQKEVKAASLYRVLDAMKEINLYQNGKVISTINYQDLVEVDLNE